MSSFDALTIAFHADQIQRMERNLSHLRNVLADYRRYETDEGLPAGERAYWSGQAMEYDLHVVAAETELAYWKRRAAEFASSAAGATALKGKATVGEYQGLIDWQRMQRAIHAEVSYHYQDGSMDMLTIKDRRTTGETDA